MAKTKLPASCEELLRALVAVDSVNPTCGGPADGQSRLAFHIEAWAGQWRLNCEHFELPGGGFNLLVTSEVSPTAEWLLFDSHLDTVAIDGMTVSPFEVTLKDGRYSGRGVCDTKGSGAAMLWALRDYAAQAARPRNVGVLFSVDEESLMTGARAFSPILAKQFGTQ